MSGAIQATRQVTSQTAGIRGAERAPGHGATPVDRRRWIGGLAAAAASAALPAAGQEPSLRTLYVTDDIDRAVQQGVDYLIELQRSDGAIADRGYEIAMTSLSIMSMAAIGIQPDELTRRGRAMVRALDYILDDRHQDDQGYFGNRDGSRMYGQGITTLMLTEMLGMGASLEQNERLHEAVASAIELILAAQAVPKPERLQGGWRYTPTSHDSDLSVSVWQLMALRSAKNDGLEVAGEAIDKALNYLGHSYTASRSPNGTWRDDVAGFSYTPGTLHPTFAMTAAGLLAMQVCGRYESPLVAGAAKWLLQHSPEETDRFFYYGLYYYAQGMHQAGGEFAETADEIVPSLLLEKQRSDGSWLARRGEERNVGSVYSTALAVLSLSVRYHYLPIYQR